MVEPSSLRACHSPVASSRTSSPPDPFSVNVALSVAQHRSPVGFLPLLPSCSLLEPQDAYRRSIEPPGANSNPSPTHEGWLFVAVVRPSTPPEEYEMDACGNGPPSAGGLFSG